MVHNQRSQLQGVGGEVSTAGLPKVGVAGGALTDRGQECERLVAAYSRSSWFWGG